MHDRKFKNWKEFVVVDEQKSVSLKEENLGSNFAVAAYLCKFCGHEFTYYSRNGPRTIRRHLAKRHSDAFESNGSQNHVPNELELVDVGLGSHHENYGNSVFPQPYEENSELEFANKWLAKQWRNHFNLNVEKSEIRDMSTVETTEAVSPVDAAADAAAAAVAAVAVADGTLEVYECRYCGLKLYYSENNSSTMVKHLEKHIKNGDSIGARNFEQTTAVTLARCLKTWRKYYTKRDQNEAASIKAGAKTDSAVQDIYQCNFCLQPKTYSSRNGPKTLTKHLRKYHSKEIISRANMSECKSQNKGCDLYALDTKTSGANSSADSSTSANLHMNEVGLNGRAEYTEGRFHEDVIRLLNEQKQYASLIKSAAFRNLIKNLRPEFLAALDEMKSYYYSTFLQYLESGEGMVE